MKKYLICPFGAKCKNVGCFHSFPHIDLQEGNCTHTICHWDEKLEERKIICRPCTRKEKLKYLLDHY